MKYKRLICLLLAFLTAVAPAVFSVETHAVSVEEQVYRFIKDELGFNDAQACGILSNVYGESNFNPTAYAIDVDGLPSYGLFMWHMGRLDELKSYCSSNGLDYTTVDGQLRFMKYELFNGEKISYAQMLGIPNTADGAYIAGYNWAKFFERCNTASYEVRGNRAKTMYWPKYGGDPDEPLYCTITEGVYYLRNNSTGLYMTVPSHAENNGADVAVSNLILDDYFRIYVKKSVGGYLLKPIFTTGPVVNIYANIVQSGKNVTLYQPTGSMSQEWYFDMAEGGYIIRSVQVPDCVMDLSGNSVKVFTYTGAASQIWSLVPASLPSAVTPVVCAGKSGEITTISWSADDNADSYEITVYDKDRNYNAVFATVFGTEYNVALQDGSYAVRVDAANSPLKEAGPYRTRGVQVDFIVEKLHEHSFTGRHETVTEATCVSTGLEKIYCSDPDCGEYITSVIPVKDHTFVRELTPATRSAQGKIERICSVCGYSYIETLLDIPTLDDPMISVSDMSANPGKTVDVPITFFNPSGTKYASFNVENDGAGVQLLEIISSDGNVTDLTQSGNSVRFLISDTNTDIVTLVCKFYVKSDASENVQISVSYGLQSFSDNNGNYVYPALDAGTIYISDSDLLYGDANNDGGVNMKDILLMRKIIAGAEDDSAINITLADVNGDGKIDFKDLLFLRKFVSGEITVFPVQQ